TSYSNWAVRSVLEDSLANFHVKQTEPEWASVAYALYLPLDKLSWTDKFSKALTFEDLTRELLSRKFSSSLPCEGTHLLFSLVVILRRDQLSPCLSYDTRGQVWHHLKQVAAHLQETQSEAGTW